MHTDLCKAADILGIELQSLEKAAKRSDKLVKEYKELIDKNLKEIFGIKQIADLQFAEVVLLGSIARGEITEGSDLDYFILQNGASPQTTQTLITAVERFRQELEFEEPGGQGVFGNIVIAPNLYESIGLDIDTNLNMTRRLLLLTESIPITTEKTYTDVIEKILYRYCSDYLPPQRADKSEAKVPRFLLNDLVRLWRTMAVDFGTKRWRSTMDDSHLRLAKLRITRKILFVGPLATLLLIRKRIHVNNEMLVYLKEWLSKPPLVQLASTAELLSDDSKDALKKLLLNYNKFIDILNGEERDILQSKIIVKSTKLNALKCDCRHMGDEIQKSLEIIFYGDELFKQNFQKYAVF